MNGFRIGQLFDEEKIAFLYLHFFFKYSNLIPFNIKVAIEIIKIGHQFHLIFLLQKKWKSAKFSYLVFITCVAWRQFEKQFYEIRKEFEQDWFDKYFNQIFLFLFTLQRPSVFGPTLYGNGTNTTTTGSYNKWIDDFIRNIIQKFNEFSTENVFWTK